MRFGSSLENKGLDAQCGWGPVPRYWGQFPPLGLPGLPSAPGYSLLGSVSMTPLFSVLSSPAASLLKVWLTLSDSLLNAILSLLQTHVS